MDFSGNENHYRLVEKTGCRCKTKMIFAGNENHDRHVVKISSTQKIIK